MKLKEAWRGGRQWKGARATGAGRQRIHQQWMAAFSDEIERLNPKMVGRIDWDSAQYLKDKGMKPKEAAKKLAKRPVKESNISRMDMSDVAIFADDAVPNDKDKWKVSTRAAKRKFGEASSEAKKRYVQKHYRERGGTFK